MHGEDVLRQVVLPAELSLADGALERLPLLVNGFDVPLEVVVPGEALRALLTGERLRRRLIVLVLGQHVGAQVVLLRELLAALDAVERPDLLVHGRVVLLQVVLSGEPVLADVALPVPALLLLQPAVLAEGDAAARDDGLVGDGVAEGDPAVLVFAVQGRWVRLPLLFGVGALLVHAGDVALQRHDAAVNLKTNFKLSNLSLN